MQDYHAEFVEIYNKNITRPGADRLLNWLETTDFFTAPASTRTAPPLPPKGLPDMRPSIRARNRGNKRVNTHPSRGRDA